MASCRAWRSASTFSSYNVALDTLKRMGVDTENAARQSGIRAPRTFMTHTSNRT